MSNVIEENNKGKIFIKRLIFMVIFQIILVCVLVSRFVFLQIINYDSFKNKSQNNSVKFFVIPPLRGNFLDRNNVKLTNNRKSYNVFLYREKKNRIPEGDIENVANILNLSPEEQNRVNKQLWSQRDKMTVNILSNLTWDKLINLEKNSYRLKNISVEEGHVREYLFPNEMSHIIGYVSAPNEGDIARLSNALPRDVLLNPDFKVGKNGLESALNGVLTGSGGYRKVEVNANNVPLREMEKKLPAPANDMRLTIDINLQQFIFKRMEGKSGGVVVLNVNTGEILAMVSTPSFNGNDFVDGISNEYWNELLNNPQKPLYNKTITGLYSPGSTFKPIVALAALESNSWNEKKTYVCAGKFKLGKTEFNCWTRHAHGSLNIVEALERSCNPFFINLALSTEINKIFEVAGNLGIGEHFDLNLSEFKDGILPTKDWKYKTLRDVWVKGDTANMSIGHGFLLVNPLQMAVVVSRIANGGYPIKPYLLYDDVEKQDYNRMIFNLDAMFRQKNADIVKKGMLAVVNGKHGTASWVRIKNKEKYGLAGKTGTAQVISTALREEMESDEAGLRDEFKHHGWFIGFAPADNPKYGVAALVEHGGMGGVAAAPVALETLKYAIDNNI